MKIQKVVDNNLVEENFPFIPKYLSKFKFIVDDTKSLVSYFLLNRKAKPSVKVNCGIISPSTFCNGNCVFCANCYLKDERKVMDFETFKRGVKFLKHLGLKDISITPTIGDILLDKGIFKKIDYLKKGGFKTSVYTNIISLKKENFPDFLKIDVIHIDLGDILPERDSEVFRISKEASEKRLKILEELLNYMVGEKIKKRIFIDFRSPRSPKKLMKDIKKSFLKPFLAEGLVEIACLQAFDNWGGLVKKNDLIGNQTLKIAPKIKIYPCQNLFTISILPDGDVRLCGCRCLNTLKDELVIGNINRESFKDLINSKKWRELVENFKLNQPEVCKNCSFYRPYIK